MADIAIFRINYKSDFILTLQSDAGWLTPFCIKFWTGAPSQAYFAGYDGTTYTHCAPVDGDPTKLSVQFDDHHLPIGDLKFQIGYHFTVADFPTSIEDEVINQAAVIIDNDGEQQQVMLDFNGETAPDIAFSLPAYANEAQRIANEQVRIAAEEQRVSNEQQRISNEEGRISAEERRQEHEQQRIHNEETRIAEFARLEADAIAATGAANDAATLANEKAQLASDKAALAQSAATLASDKAQLAADKAALAQAAATLANDKAALAQQKADYAQAKGDYAQAQGDYAKAQGDIALADHERAETDHERAEADHDTATDDHTTATSDHTQAESDHTRAEADHTTAASDHTQASSDHDRAESDHTQAGNDHTRAESDHTRAESDHAAVEVYVDSLGAFDISSYHATGGVLAKYADLTAALGTNGANIPEGIRKGGMSVKFVQSSDNKYVQYRLMSTAWSITESDWQGVDDIPTIESDNLVKSGGVNGRFVKQQTTLMTTDDGDCAIEPIEIGAFYYDGTVSKNRYVLGYGLSDYIPYRKPILHIISGVWQLPNTNYVPLAFFDSSRTFISFYSGTLNTEIVNADIDVPHGTAYIRLTMLKDTPAVISYTGAISDGINAANRQIGYADELLNLDVVEVSSAHSKSILKNDGTIVSTNNAALGVSDYINVVGGSTIHLRSGAYRGTSAGRAWACFYSSNDETSFISALTTPSGTISDIDIDVPADANYMRLSIADKSIPAVIDMKKPYDVVSIAQDIDSIKHKIDGQMHNPPLPIKSTDDELNILLIGSSYGVDTISALVDICTNVGLKVNTGDMYKSGGTTAQYLDDIANGDKNVVYYNSWNSESTYLSQTVRAALRYKQWDVVIVQDSSVRLATETDGLDVNFVKFMSYLKQECTNPRVVFAFNATWVHKNNMAKQPIAYREAFKLARQSGIDVIIPSGSAIEYLRATSVNDGNDIYRDELHLNVGVGRFTAACALYYAIPFYVFGMSLANCTLTGVWDSQGQPSSTYPVIAVTDDNRDICISAAKHGSANVWHFNEEIV